MNNKPMVGQVSIDINDFTAMTNELHTYRNMISAVVVEESGWRNSEILKITISQHVLRLLAEEAMVHVDAKADADRPWVFETNSYDSIAVGTRPQLKEDEQEEE